jgi:hypothetical protein
MLLHNKPNIEKVFAPALKEAESARSANYIRVTPIPGGVCLTTIIKGKELAWINFSVEQSEELIRLIRAHGDMSGKAK